MHWCSARLRCFRFSGCSGVALARCLCDGGAGGSARTQHASVTGLSNPKVLVDCYVAAVFLQYFVSTAVLCCAVPFFAGPPYQNKHLRAVRNRQITPCVEGVLLTEY